MARTTRCGVSGWVHSSAERVRSFGMSRWTQAMSSRWTSSLQDRGTDSTPTVGDSPRGPLKRQGNPHLKPATKPKPNTPYLTTQDTAHAAMAPAAHQAAHSKTPSNRFRLARGCAPPSCGLRPDRGGAPPSSEVHLARGSAPPSNGVRLARGRPARAACSRAQALNALTSAGRRHHAPGARAPVPPHQLPRRKPIPITVGGGGGDCAARPVPDP
jgi:hypothetical protein